MVVVAFYTKNTPYENEVQDFIESMNEFKVRHTIYPIKSQDCWELNCAMKPRVLFDALHTIDDNILYLDIDSRMEREPPFEEIERDIPGLCFYQKKRTSKRGPSLLSGTIYLPNNQSSINLVRDWIHVQQAHPYTWDQQTLQAVSAHHEHFEMPLKWVKIFDQKMCDEEPVIVHYQASRLYKSLIE
jgi:hypothetical protein